MLSSLFYVSKNAIVIFVTKNNIHIVHLSCLTKLMIIIRIKKGVQLKLMVVNL